MRSVTEIVSKGATNFKQGYVSHIWEGRSDGILGFLHVEARMLLNVSTDKIIYALWPSRINNTDIIGAHTSSAVEEGYRK